MPATSAPLTRKQRRLAEKRLKKVRRIAFQAKKSVDKVMKDTMTVATRDDKKPTNKKARKQKKAPLKHGENEEDASKMKMKSEVKRQRELIKEDDHEIKQLFKKLGYNKRKSKSTPGIFAAEGLDYLLDFCDHDKREQLLKESDESNDDDSDGDKDGSDGDEDGSDDELQSDASHDLPMETTSSERSRRLKVPSDDEDTVASHAPATQIDKSVHRSDEKTEDIYGRTLGIDRDPSAARRKLNELEEHIHARADDDNLQQLQQLQRRVRALINRLSERTMQKAIDETKALLSDSAHTRQDIRQMIANALLSTVGAPQPLSTVLALDIALYVALVHNMVDMQLAAHIVEIFAVRLHTVCEQSVDGGDASEESRALNNIALMFCRLFQFKVIKSTLLFDLLTYSLTQAASDAGGRGEQHIFIALNVLHHVGLSLRKDDVTAMHKWLIGVVDPLSTIGTVLTHATGVVDALRTACDCVRNNDPSYLPNKTETDSEHVLRYVKLKRGLLKGSPIESPLTVGLHDLWAADERGRWWIVGAACVQGPNQVALTSHADSNTSKYDANLVQLARKIGMKSETRVAVFCTLCTATDAHAAFEALNRLRLKDQQERELIHVCVMCCMRERTYNNFYAQVIADFARFHKRFKTTTQYAMWDRVRDLTTMSPSARRNIALLTVDLIVGAGVLGVDVLRVVDMTELDAATSVYLRRVLVGVLSATDGSDNDVRVRALFTPLTRSRRLRTLVDGLLLFLTHTVRRWAQRRAADDAPALLQRVQTVIDLCAESRLDTD